MKEALTKILALKVNMVGTMAVAVAASLVTTFASQLFVSQSFRIQSAGTPTPMAATALPSVLDCDQGVYSPVQRSCVSQETFDAEMQRLFAALGINTSAYDLSTANLNSDAAGPERTK